jgi:hypothetical protein
MDHRQMILKGAIVYQRQNRGRSHCSQYQIISQLEVKHLKVDGDIARRVTIFRDDRARFRMAKLSKQSDTLSGSGTI